MTVSGVGAHTLSYYAVDGAGNTQAGYSVRLVTIAADGQSATLKAASDLPTVGSHLTPHGQHGRHAVRHTGRAGHRRR